MQNDAARIIRRPLAQNIGRAYVVLMNQPGCPECGAELLLEARFCRQCGVAVSVVNAIDKSEMPTAVLSPKTQPQATQRLDPRPTSGRAFTAAEKAETIEASGPRRRKLPASVIFAVVLLAVIGIVSAVAFVRMKNRNSTIESAALIYPGSKTITDMSNERGGRSIHLQTNDSLERVADWYQETLKPSKVVRLTSTNIVMKNQDVTATLAADGSTVNILIKQVEKE